MLTHYLRKHSLSLSTIVQKHCGPFVLIRDNARIEDLQRQAPAREATRGESSFLCKRKAETDCGHGAKSS